MDIVIEKGRREEIDQLLQIEREAGTLFSREDLPVQESNAGLSSSFFDEPLSAGRLWVAREASSRKVVGFAAVIVVDGSPHLHEMDVLPAYGRRGIGRSLLMHVVRWAKGEGYASLTLITFRHVPFNGPFYRSAGFLELRNEEIGSELRALLRGEANQGLDPKKRAAMILDLQGSQ